MTQPAAAIADDGEQGVVRRELPVFTGLVIIHAGSKLAGFIEKQLLAWCFGTSAVVEAYFVATSAFNACYYFVRELCEPILVPGISNALAKRELTQIAGLVRMALLGVVAFSAIVVAGTLIDTDLIAQSLAPGFSTTNRSVLASMLRIATISVAIMNLVALGQAILDGYGRFRCAAFSTLLQKLGLCGAVLAALLAPSPPVAIAAGVVAASLFPLAWMTATFRSSVRSPRRMWSAGNVDGALLSRLTLPLLVGTGFSQLRELLENHFASTAALGAVAARIYAKRLVEFPIFVVVQSVTSIALKRLSVVAATGDMSGLRRRYRSYATALLGMFVPITAFVFFGAELISAVVFRYGSFGEEAHRLTAAALRVYALAIPAMAVEPLMVAFFFSLRNTAAPVSVGIACTLLEVALLAPLTARFGLPGIAAAFVLGRSAKVIILAFASSRIVKIAPRLQTQP